MKKIIVVLLMFAASAVYSQPTQLFTVHTVKPKSGQKMAFEAAYKLHVAKFHKEQKITVSEILSGPYTGYFHVINATTFVELDKERSDAAAHDLDLDKSYFAFLEDDVINATYKYIDSLSFHSDMQAEKALVTVRHIKSSLEDDYRKETAKTLKLLKTLTGRFWQNLSLQIYEQIWDGSDPVVVSVRNLKDGFASLETDFYGAPGSSANFKDEYIKMYGTLDWDKRVKLLDEAIVKSEQYILKDRKDLSSK
jgi:hypothetical protein